MVVFWFDVIMQVSSPEKTNRLQLDDWVSKGLTIIYYTVGPLPVLRGDIIPISRVPIVRPFRGVPTPCISLYLVAAHLY